MSSAVPCTSIEPLLGSASLDEVGSRTSKVRAMNVSLEMKKVGK